MGVKYFAKLFVKLFPEYKSAYQKHIARYGEILGHNFFGDLINTVLVALLLENKEINLIKQYIDFIQDMYSRGNDAVKNIIEVTVLEYLGDDDKALRNAFTYFSEDLMQVSKMVEAQIGRRNIHIYYKKGNVFADWNYTVL